MSRRPAHVARRRHINIVRHARVVGDDVERSVVLCAQRADDLRALAFENADDRAGVLIAVAEIFPAHVAAHQHAVFVQRRAGGAFGNGDFLEARIVRLEKTFARAVHADAAGNQIRVARAGVEDLLARETFFRELAAIEQHATAIEAEYDRRFSEALDARIAAVQEGVRPAD